MRVNGVLLGAEPTPLVHGDKVEVAGLELRYADDARGGATQFVNASEIAALAPRRPGGARATTASGGRIVSLVDGKEYSVPGDGLVFGRDASCDVVVPESEVSRRHAEVVAGENGYLVKDTSANGIYVNGTRVEVQQLLRRSDVIRIGTEEFRFYADVAPVAAAVAVPVPAPAAAPPAPAPAPAPVPAAVAAPQKHEDPRPLLAVLQKLNEGPDKGATFEVRTPLAHVGRGAHNDVQLIDESVSDSHAKLQRRDDGWYVVDMESTNGTYIGGNRLSGERRIDGSPDIRFGGLKFRFTATGGFDADAKGTRAIATMRPPVPGAAQSTARIPTPPSSPNVPTALPADPSPVPEPDQRGGIPTAVWAVAGLLVAAAVAFFVLKG